MREGIGSVFLYNIIIIFIIVLFALLSATVNYYKAFKVNSNVAKELEIYEGYNMLSDQHVANQLLTLGYRQVDSANCPEKYGQEAISLYEHTANFDICLYRYEEDERHYTYGVLTYMHFDLPLVSDFKVQVFSKTERIFDFENAPTS